MSCRNQGTVGEGPRIALPPQTFGLPPSCPADSEPLQRLERLERHSTNCLRTSVYPKRRYSSGLSRTPALYYSAGGPRNQMTAEPSRVMVQHPTAYRHDHPHVDPGALAVPQISNRQTVTASDSTILHQCSAEGAGCFEGIDQHRNSCQPTSTVSFMILREKEPGARTEIGGPKFFPVKIGHARPRNLRITTEFSTSTALGSAYEYGLPQAVKILITRNFDICYFIHLPKGTPPGAIDHKVFAKYDIPEQERSSWSIFRVAGFQPVGYALDPQRLWEECKGAAAEERVLLFLILPCNPELMASHLRRLLDTPDRLPNNQQIVSSSSQVITSAHPLSGVSSTPVLPVLSEYEDEVDEYIPAEPGTGSVESFNHLCRISGDPPLSKGKLARRISPKLDEGSTSNHKFPVTPPIRVSELEPLPEGLLHQQSSSRSQWLFRHSPPSEPPSTEHSGSESITGSSFQDGSSLSSGPSHRPSLLHPLESTSGRTLESLHSRNPSPESALQSFQVPSTHGNGSRSSIQSEYQDQCIPGSEFDDPVSVEKINSTTVGPIHSFSDPPHPSSPNKTPSQRRLESCSSEDSEGGETSSCHCEGSYSSCSSSDFLDIQASSREKVVESSASHNHHQSDSMEQNLNDEISWFDSLLDNAFKPLAEGTTGISLSCDQDLMRSTAQVKERVDFQLTSSSSHESFCGNSKEKTTGFQHSASPQSHPHSQCGEYSRGNLVGMDANEKEDLYARRPIEDTAFEDVESESEDIQVSDEFQVPMVHSRFLETNPRIGETHLSQCLRPMAEKSREIERKTCPQEKLFSDRCWATRPAVDKVCDNLEKSFPNHNVDQPIEVRVLDHPQSAHYEQPYSSPQGFKRVLSIRSSIRSRKGKCRESSLKKVESLRADPLHDSPEASPRNSVKLWGYKTEEILPGSQTEFPHASSSSADLGQSGPSNSLKWVKGKLIGCGSFGMVYLALNVTNQAMMAVKQVKIGDQSSNRPLVKSALESIKLEICFLKDLEHPNIVQYLGFEETLNNCNIFLEYVEGGSIGSCVSKHGKLEQEVVKSFTKQILGGLEYLHSSNIMHRDLKADNVLVDLIGRCKISDFGISKRSNEAYLTSQYTPMQGTVFSMAPEVFNQPMACRYSAKADIWSLGCLVLEMLCGSRAWTGYGSLQIIYKVGIERRQPEIPHNLLTDKFQNHFLNKCLEIEPCSRPTASRLIDHLFLELDPDWQFRKSELFRLL
ncbi:hypothetical protein KEM48_007890 [Puccinia striiformis f. sp. tritici PST-130]|nr:hypothetical protein KEM48_007890 [Puccinia striiformis f. sp. tritici PST-130]